MTDERDNWRSEPLLCRSCRRNAWRVFDSDESRAKPGAFFVRLRCATPDCGTIITRRWLP